MANAALNPATGVNNLLALVLQKAAEGRGDVAYTDTGEPTVVTDTITTAYVVQANFSKNGLGNQPPVSQGAWAMITHGLSTATAISTIVVEAVDTTSTSGGHTETIAGPGIAIGAFGPETCFMQPFASSLAAGVDGMSGLTNVVGLRATIVLSATGGGLEVKFCAAGSP